MSRIYILKGSVSQAQLAAEASAKKTLQGFGFAGFATLRQKGSAGPKGMGGFQIKGPPASSDNAQ